MQLPSPVTIHGNFGALTISELSPLFVDDPAHKRVVARLHQALRFLDLWRGEDYDAVGDWTQAQAEDRILELLAPDARAILQALVLPS